MRYKILHIEDSKTDADLIKRLLQKEMDFDYYWADDKESYLKGLSEFNPDVILSDHMMPQFDSKMAFEIYKQKNLDIPFILVTGTVSEEFAVMMMKSGLDDYLLKTNLQRLPQAIINAFSKKENDKKIKQIEAELKRSESNLRTIFDNAAQGFILVDTTGNIIELNDRVNYFINIGWRKDLKKKDNLFEVIPEFRREYLKEFIAEALRGNTVRFESDFKAGDATTLYFDVNVSPITDVAGTITGHCITINDISERKRNEEKLKQLSQAVEQSPASVIITDVNGNIQYVNSKFTDITGYRPEEVIGKNPRILKSGNTPSNEYGILWKSITSGREWHGEFLNKKKNGESYWELALISPILNAKGEITNFLAVKEDITKRKKAEEEILQKNQQLSLLSDHLENIREEERSNIAREIHDELGQQLTVMKMDVSLLQKKIATTKEPPELKLTDLGNLIDQTIQTVRRLAFELRPSMLDDLGLYSTIDWYVQEFEKRTGLKIFMTTDKEERLDKKITTNLFRILQECLTNVARHAKATEVKIDLKMENNNFFMTVRDNGKGFDTCTKNKKTLGILGMRERTIIMHGECCIESIQGKGTIVNVKVPVHFSNKKDCKQQSAIS
jgi:PAS domain S-box-containing protein